MSSPSRPHGRMPVAVVCGLLVACGTDGPTKAPSAPRFVDLAVTPATLTESSLVTVAASVVDDDGDLASGRLETESGASLGLFTATAGAAFVFVLSWQGLNAAEPIELEGSETRTLRVTFVDRSEHRTSTPITIGLECATGAACDGRCVDRASDPDHCGRCGHACDASARLCERGQCAPSPSACVRPSGTMTCNDVCAAAEGRCSETECAALGAGSNIAYYDDESLCARSGGGRGAAPCDFPLDPGLGAFARCCCSF